MNIYKYIYKVALSRPNRVAFVYKKKKYYYRELLVMVESLRKIFLSEGLSSKNKIAIYLKNSPEFIITYMALASIGVISVPINNEFDDDEIRYVLKDSKVENIITSIEFRNTLKNTIKKLDCNVYFIDNIINKKSNLKKHQLSQTVKETKTNTCTINYFKDKFGKIKRCSFTHKNIVRSVELINKTINIKIYDNFICYLSMTDTFCFITYILAPLSMGARFIVVQKVNSIRKFINEVLKLKASIVLGSFEQIDALNKASFPKLLKLFFPVRLFIELGEKPKGKDFKKAKNKFKIQLINISYIIKNSEFVKIKVCQCLKKD